MSLQYSNLAATRNFFDWCPSNYAVTFRCARPELPWPRRCKSSSRYHVACIYTNMRLTCCSWTSVILFSQVSDKHHSSAKGYYGIISASTQINLGFWHPTFRCVDIVNEHFCIIILIYRYIKYTIASNDDKCHNASLSPEAQVRRPNDRREH